jgi:hypothetical protein
VARRRFWRVFVAALAVIWGMAATDIAYAKMLPLEVQVSSPTKTVRVTPKDFYSRVNVAGALPYFGIFDFLDNRPADQPTEPLATISLFVLTSRTRPHTVLQVEGPDAMRETVVSFSYYASSNSSFGQIVPGGSETLRPGRWVRFSPAFSSLVEESLASFPNMEPVSAPPQKPPPKQVRGNNSSVVVGGFGAAIVLLLVSVLLVLRWSYSVLRRQTRSYGKSDAGAA